MSERDEHDRGAESGSGPGFSGPPGTGAPAGEEEDEPSEGEEAKEVPIGIPSERDEFRRLKEAARDPDAREDDAATEDEAPEEP